MKELNFETGLITYLVNGTAEISFNPGDIGFVERLFNTFDGLAKNQEAAEEQTRTVTGAALFELAKSRDRAMREEIDGLFGQPVCDKVFGEVNVYSQANGLPLWCNFLMAIVDEVDASAERGQMKTTERVDKYMAKYAKYNKK